MRTKELLKILAWEVINPLMLELKKNRKYTFPAGYTGLNLGCGINNPEKWIGIDGGLTNYLINRYPKILSKPLSRSFNISRNASFDDYITRAQRMKLVHHELNYGIPYQDNSVPNIYSSHFFEHLFKSDAEYLFKECFRVLKPNGRIRICVPSLDSEVATIEHAIQEYRKGNSTDIQRYVTLQSKGYTPAFSNHRWMYNFEEMYKVMESIGFQKIEQFQPKQGQIPDVTELDTRDGLLIEATKF